MTHRRLFLPLLAVLGLALSALPAQLEAQRRQRDRINREEILASPHKALDLYQVVRSIRPQFLEPPRGVRSLGAASTLNPTVVYVDGKRETGIDALKLMQAMDIEEVRYYEPSRSEMEFGPTANGGAIVIKRHKAPRVIPAGVADTTKPPATQ